MLTILERNGLSDTLVGEAERLMVTLESPSEPLRDKRGVRDLKIGELLLAFKLFALFEAFGED